MGRVESIAGGIAISAAPENGIELVPEPGPNPESGTDDDWFVACAIDVFGKKEAGLHLHMATGWPRTSCYAFVARDPEQRRKPSPQFLRILFRSKHGRPFRNAFMAGCDAEWWIEEQRAADIGRKVVALVERK